MREPPDAGLCQALVQQAPDGIIFADREGVIRLWNAGAQVIWGYPAAEAIGRSLDLLIPERFREAHWTGFRRAIAEGKTKYMGQVLPTRSVRKDGTTIYLDLTLAIVRAESGEVTGAMAIARDITQRRTQEKELRDRLAELEQQVKGLVRPSA